MSDSIQRLTEAVLAVRGQDPALSRTAKLFRDGIEKMAKKLVEEAAEVGIDALKSDRAGVIRESADLMFNLAVLWVEVGVSPQDVWDEMERRERMLGIAEKLPKNASAATPHAAGNLESIRPVSGLIKPAH